MGFADGRSAGFDGEEISQAMVRLMAAYVRALKPPRVAARAGGELFGSAGCAACHRPEMAAHGGGSVSIFSDLLLHDLGPALSGVAAEDGASPAEWRTAPLMDMGGDKGRRRYLHDGRAASVESAVLQHGGEGAASRRAFQALDPASRRMLVEYVEGL